MLYTATRQAIDHIQYWSERFTTDHGFKPLQVRVLCPIEPEVSCPRTLALSCRPCWRTRPTATMVWSTSTFSSVEPATPAWASRRALPVVLGHNTPTTRCSCCGDRAVCRTACSPRQPPSGVLMAYNANPFMERSPNADLGHGVRAAIFAQDSREASRRRIRWRGACVPQCPPALERRRCWRVHATGASRVLEPRNRPELSESFQKLLNRGLLTEGDSPQLLGVFLSCASGFADLPSSEGLSRKGCALLDCRIVAHAAQPGRVARLQRAGATGRGLAGLCGGAQPSGHPCARQRVGTRHLGGGARAARLRTADSFAGLRARPCQPICASRVCCGCSRSGSYMKVAWLPANVC